MKRKIICDRDVKPLHNGYYFSKETVLIPRIVDGYYKVSLYKDGIGKSYFVHRLIANAFICNPLSKPCVNHIDSNRLNNSIENLEWVTVKENAIHAASKGRIKGMLGKKHSQKTKKKISEKKKGTKLTEYQKQRLLEANRGRKQSDEAKAKISKALLRNRGRSKLSNNDILSIRELYKNGLMQKHIAEIYEILPGSVSSIVNFKSLNYV